MSPKIITLLSLIVLIIIPLAQASDWPMFGHDLAHTGTTDEVVEPPLELLWKTKIGTYYTSSSPAISGGLVYVGSPDQNVYSLEALTGKVVWKYTAGEHETFGSSPAVSNGIVYIGSGDSGPGGSLYAFDASTGVLKWKYTPGDTVGSSPAIYGGIVYFGSHDKNVYALDAITGALIWKYTTGDIIISSPAVFDNVVYISSRDSNLYALDTVTGNLKWKYRTGPVESPIVSGGIIYAGSSSGDLYALDASKGTLKWKYNVGGIDASPAINDGVVFFGSNKNVYAIDASTGMLKWNYSTECVTSESSPIVSNGVVYIGSIYPRQSCDFYAFDATNGELKWKYKLGEGMSSSPAISGGIIYVFSTDGYLYAFKPSRNSSAGNVGASVTTNAASSPKSTPNLEQKDTQQDSTSNGSNNTLYWIIFAGIIVYTGQYFLKSRSSSSPAKNKALELKQSQETASRSFEEGFNLSQEASAFFARKNFKRALESYNKALTKFESAQNSPHIDASLSTSIKNNKTSGQSNIVSCKLALGSSASEQGKTSLDKGDLNNAIKSYNNAKSYFEEALQDASVIKDEEKLKNAKELLSQTITNIENCYINIDMRKVEELSKSAELMLKEAEGNRNRKELSKAREVLKNAENSIEEAFDIATRRGFNEAQRILSTLLKNVRAEKNVVDSLFMTPIEKIKTDHRVSDVLALEPEIMAVKNINDIQVLRGYSVLSNNDLKFGIRLINSTNFVITDADVILDYTKNLFSMKTSEIQHLGNIIPNGKRTASYILKPLGCIHKENIGATVIFKDHTGNKQTLHMRPKEVHCVCPFLKEKPISEGEYSRLAVGSEFVQEGISFKGISVEELAKFMGETCRHMLHKVREYDLEGKKVIYLSGESVGEKAFYLLTAVIQDYKGLTQIVLRAHSDKKYGLNGFMNEMADSLRHLVGLVQNAKEIGIIENTQVINIIDSVVQRTNFQMGEGGNAIVNIKDSVVQRRKIGKE